MKLTAIAAFFICTAAHAVCIGSYPQCNAYAQQQYGQTYQQYEQSQQQNWNQPAPQQYQYTPPTNQNGFDRYGHYHAAGY